MTTIYNLRAATNVTFRLTRDFSSLASVYNLVAATIRMQARVAAIATDPPIYEWCSANVGGGLAAFDAATGLCVFSAPASDMARMPARLVYDCRLELTGGAIVPLFSGRMAFLPGVTRTALDAVANGLLSVGDTVAVEGETTPAVLPVAMTAAVVAAQAASAAAAASAGVAADRASAAAQSAQQAAQSVAQAAQSSSDAAQSAAAAAESARLAAIGPTSLAPSILMASFASLSQSDKAALAQLLIAVLPDMSGGAVPVASGQAFVDASGFFVRAV